MTQALTILGQAVDAVLTWFDQIFDSLGAWTYVLFAVVIYALVSSVLVPLFTKSGIKAGRKGDSSKE
jgi:hypothetical protein